MRSLGNLGCKLPDTGDTMFKRLFGNNRKSSDYRIMVVDDDQPVRQTIVDILEDEGFHVIAANSGDEALRMLDQAALPDAIIVDLMMPIMDGQEFIRRSRVRFGRTTFCPILLLTAARHGEKTANEIEVEDYLPKPFDQDSLLHHVSTLIANRGDLARNA
jgi:CheY-like chemotaxis protein